MNVFNRPIVPIQYNTLSLHRILPKSNLSVFTTRSDQFAVWRNLNVVNGSFVTDKLEGPLLGLETPDLDGTVVWTGGYLFPFLFYCFCFYIWVSKLTEFMSLVWPRKDLTRWGSEAVEMFLITPLGVSFGKGWDCILMFFRIFELYYEFF